MVFLLFFYVPKTLNKHLKILTVVSILQNDIICLRKNKKINFQFYFQEKQKENYLHNEVKRCFIEFGK